MALQAIVNLSRLRVRERDPAQILRRRRASTQWRPRPARRNPAMKTTYLAIDTTTGARIDLDTRIAWAAQQRLARAADPGPIFARSLVCVAAAFAILALLAIAQRGHRDSFWFGAIAPVHYVEVAIDGSLLTDRR